MIDDSIIDVFIPSQIKSCLKWWIAAPMLRFLSPIAIIYFIFLPEAGGQDRPSWRRDVSSL